MSKEKDKYYSLFKNLLIEIDTTVTDEQVFLFLKSFDVLEYDFGHESSVSKTGFLSLIHLAKSSDEVSAIIIWNTVFAFVSNSNSKGGYFTNNSIPNDIANLFSKITYSQTQKKLLELSQQNFEILELIDDTIGGVNLQRQAVNNEALEKFNKNQILILTGDPGVGKSAAAKALFNEIKQRSNGYVLLYKADQLNAANLRDSFLPFGIQLKLSEIFSHFPLYRDNVIYVDAVEKLLEGEGLAFKQLLKAIEDFPVKLVLSCRKANLNLIELKFFHQRHYDILNVPILNDTELSAITKELPVLKNITQNKRLLSLIRIPKYLDYAFKAISKSGEDYSQINEVEFINKLWTIIVENRINENHNGLPSRRSRLFIDLSVARAKLLQPFVKSPANDDIAIEKLLKDNVIVESTISGGFAPAHDVLEDWALIRYVNEQFLNIQDDVNFFVLLGTHPAMRRAYRLWVQTALKEQDETKINFFTRNLRNAALDKFWKDESLIAVLNSDYCEAFFKRNLSLLKENNWQLFFQIVHVMRTACRENFNDKKLFIPVGNGWAITIKILHENIGDIPEVYYPLVKNMIQDWSNKVFSISTVPAETRPAGLIVIYLLNNYYKSKSTYSYEDNEVESCLKLLFNLCGGIDEEITSLLNEALKGSVREENTTNWIEIRYFEKIIELALSGLTSTQLCKHLPDSLVLLLIEKWYRKPKKRRKRGDGFFSSYEPTSDDVNYHFGIVKEHRLDYFPASAYQTPVLWLLRNHPYKALDFIIELINNATEKYIASEFSKDDNCIEIELTLNDSKKVEQHGNYVLWMMYRGTGKVTPYLLQSVLMALEYYLLEVGEWGEEFSEYFQKIIKHLYSNSNSVAITSVIASVCMVYPVMAGKQLLPLYTNRNLLSWDVSRYTHDLTPFNLGSTHPVFNEERVKSDKLAHRTKDRLGLQGFIVDYCFNIRILNKELFAIIDEHRKNADAEDILWRKKLDEMDIRTWRLTKEYSEGDKVGFLVEPSYSEDVKVQVEEWSKEQEVANITSSYQLLLLKVQKREESITLYKWREIYTYYTGLESYNVMNHAPGTLAMIGIRELWIELNDEEKKWAVLFTTEIIQKSIEKQYKPYEVSWDYSLYDIDSAMKAFPLIITLPEIEHEKEFFQKLFFKLLITHYQMNDSHYNHFLKSFDESLWANTPEDAFKFFKGLIAFAKFTTENPFYVDHSYSEEQIKDYNERYNTFIEDAYENKFPSVVDDFNYSDYSKWVLHKAILIIPSINPEIGSIVFLKKILDLWLQNEVTAKQSTRYDQLDHHIQYALQNKLSSIIFWNANTIGGELLENMLSKFFQKNILSKAFDRNKIWSFFRELVKNLIFITDNNLPDDNEEKLLVTINNFRKLWLDFNVILTKMPYPIFSDLLLLNIEWKEAAIKWKPIEGMKEFFKNAILIHGAENIAAVFNLLSHVGDKTLLPEGLKWLTILLKTAKDAKPILSYKYSEQLMHRVYDNHVFELKADRELLESYLWILDEMITQGSSDSYWIREFLISFRQTHGDVNN